ncbi:SigE family RNA polymerase sigma factor [Kineococcus sp. TRM81007]|nr:SigE family RNA polymerase sigma factor [Kineococcus sp. TRM81007]MCI2240100.1 SigE family RNA polymerase sigma factor [Kineococcus sp. TRM81007]
MADRQVGPGPGVARDGHDADDPRTWDADTAVTVLYAAHWRRLVALAAEFTGETSTAEEVVQEAFVALHRRWRRLDDRASAVAYLRQAVVNGARDVLRHRAVADRRRPLPDPAPEGPEERAVRSAEHRLVLAALDGLPARQREVLVLRYSADLSEQDIAETLGISRGAVKTHAHRGLAALRAGLTRQEGTP